MDRKEQQSDLIYQLGLLLRPILNVIEEPDKYEAAMRQRMRAQFVVDNANFRNAIRDFCREPGLVYTTELKKIFNELQHLSTCVINSVVENPESLPTNIEHLKPQIINAILSIPTPIDSTIYEANKPLAKYCRVKDLCQTVRERLVWVDRYVDTTLFYRYLRDTPENTSVIVVTRSKATKPEFMDISKLYACERGPEKYHLLVHQDIHDRWLQCDDQIYAFGGSVKDAGGKTAFTLTKIDASQKNFDKLADYIKTSQELFGPNNTQHP